MATNKLNWTDQGGPLGGLGGGTMPPGLTPPPGVSRVEPGGFWRRFAATIIDSLVVGIVSIPVSLVALYAGGITAMNPGLSGGMEFSGRYWAAQGSSLIVKMVLIYFYYGWFYKNKGATPGKLAMGLIVVDYSTGAYLGYGRAFGREVLGKMLSAFTLGIGFIMAGVRTDKRALHDLVFDTQVIHKKQ